MPEKPRTPSIERLTPAKRQLADTMLLERRQLSDRDPLRIRPVPRESVLPLSFAQQRLWFLDRLNPRQATNNLLAVWKLVGNLDISILAASLTLIISRHEVLRTTFREANGMPSQRIGTPQQVPLAIVDVSGLSGALRQRETTELTAEEAGVPFDLAEGPLMRTKVLRLKEREHLLLCTLHQIVADAWSLEILGRELAVLYDSLASDLPSPLPPLPIQYADYAVWQRQQLAGETLERGLSYWRGQLAGVPPLELPPDRPRTPSARSRSDERHGRIDRKIDEALLRLNQEEGATPFMVLLAIVQVLLSRWTGQHDIAVGTQVAGRNMVELEGLIGHFSNFLALRVDLWGEPTFRELLRRVRKVTLEAYIYQELPFEKLVEEVGPERDLSRSLLFQALVTYMDRLAAPLVSAGLAMEQQVSTTTENSSFDLAFYFRETDEGLVSAIAYRLDLFDAPTVERLALRLELLLRGAAADPDQRVSELPMLGKHERAQLLWEWNDTATAPSPLCLHELFTAQAARTPEATALIWGTQRMTYQELESLSNQLARCLRDRGVGPDVRVGVCLERSPDLVVSLLGVLRAGGAYVPLDRTYPAERLAFLLQDSGAALLITRREFGIVPRHDEIPQLLLDEEERERIARYSEIPLGRNCGERNLAYVVYTSGSTGRPKGVAIEHRSATLLITWAAQRFSLKELAGVLASTSISFDLSIFELYVPLAVGGAVVLAENALSLTSIPAASEVTLVNTVPSVIAELLRAGGLPSGVRAINLAGEPAPRQIVSSLYNLGTVDRVFNLYGPSEDTTYSTCEQIERDDERSPSIGRPITGEAVYVIDEFLNLVPLGARGELCLGGDGLARGYLGRPDLTAERFIPNPFSQEPGSRLYKTGDLTRQRPDGRLDFLGRLDAQVKLRGFRIEPGEVEAALARHPNVTEAVVLARKDLPGKPARLVAYFIARHGSFKAQDLITYLQKSLPDYMIPSAFVELPALPLTPNGKVDRRALPPPESVPAARRGEDQVPPRTPVEEFLANLWEEILGVDRVSVHDSFFALGGHSLSAAHVVSRVRSDLGIELPMAALFGSPTISSLATVLRALGDSTEPFSVSEELKSDHQASTFASSAQERFWFLSELGEDEASYNVPVSLHLSGHIDVPALDAALVEITRRHAVLRSKFSLSERRVIQQIDPQHRPSISIVDLQGLAANSGSLLSAEAERVWEREAGRRFDLSRGPLIRVVLLRLSLREHLLVVTFHHIVIDAWSIDIFARELEVFYLGFSRGRPALLPEPSQYSDFADRQRRWMEGSDAKRQLDFWGRELAGAPQVVTFPSDRTRPAVLGSRGKRVVAKVKDNAFRDFKILARNNGATVFMVLLTAFNVILRRYTGQQDLVVGTPIANRHWPATENVIGLFLNTVILRTKVVSNPSFEDLLGQVRRGFLEVLENQDLPFEVLVDELLSTRSLSFSPLFQILIVHRALSRAGSGRLITDIQIGSVGAKFDMTFSFVESEDGLIAECEYNRELFDDSTARRILGHLRGLIGGIGREPRRPILDLDLLLESERHLLVSEWNDSQGDLETLTVQERFARQAVSIRSAPAVVGARETLTYGELDERSRRLARRLAALGVGPEVPVAILMDREPALVIGVLAVLRAGGAYVPLDPDAPRERLAEILADLGDTEALVLVQDHLADHLPTGRLVSFDSEYAMAGERSGRRLAAIEPRNLAYLLFTSGTTGRPKGVAVEHRNVMAFLDWAQHYFGPEERRAVLASTSLTFDLSVFELFLPLTTGGCVVMVRDALTLLEMPRPLPPEVTLINIVPSLMSVILESGELPSSAVTVNLAGEALQRHLVNRVFESSASRRLLNLYGPTETTVYATVAAMFQHEKGEPSLGRPIRNAQGYVVNEMLEIQPIGAPGELLLGGEGIARGYWRHPESTAERFIPNPFSGAGSRLYRTGDLVRWRPDGRLEYLGRLDRQVKIRGLRIEPGDVEASLLRHPAVREAVVSAKNSPQGEPQLVAYVKLRGGEGEIRAVDLRAFLRQYLPSGLIPLSIVLTKDIPRTDRGKVDYKRLPEPDWAGEEAAEFIPPRSPAEKYLAEIWSEVLGVQHLSLNDDFFERGGHSLRAVQVSARLKQMGVVLPLRSILEKPQLGQLAQEIEESFVARGIDGLASSGDKESVLWESSLRKEVATELLGSSDDARLMYSEGAEIADLLQAILEEKACVLKRRPVVTFPATCILNAPTALHFQLVALAPIDPLLQRLARLRVLRSACVETLFIKVTASSFRVSPNLARVQVAAEGDSDLVTFKMIPLEPGMHVVEVEVFAGADRVGYFTLEIEAAVSYVN